MNHIARLQAEAAAARTELAAKADMIQAFRVHLASDKFGGIDAIATTDVLRWLALITIAGT